MRRVLAASLLVDARASLGEAPMWDTREASLVWVDILAGAVFLTTASDGWLADSADRFIRAFAYEAGSGHLAAGRPAVELRETAGKADGLCVDDAGCVWVGLWTGEAVHRYTPEGRLDTIVRVPAGQVTSCAFGGHDGSTPFITTARVGSTAEALRLEPLAGGLFVGEPGVTGGGDAVTAGTRLTAMDGMRRLAPNRSEGQA